MRQRQTETEEWRGRDAAVGRTLMPLAHRFIPLKCLVVMGAMATIPVKARSRYREAGTERRNSTRERVTELCGGMCCGSGQHQNLKPPHLFSARSEEAREKATGGFYQRVCFAAESPRSLDPLKPVGPTLKKEVQIRGGIDFVGLQSRTPRVIFLDSVYPTPHPTPATYIVSLTR